MQSVVLEDNVDERAQSLTLYSRRSLVDQLKPKAQSQTFYTHSLRVQRPQGDDSVLDSDRNRTTLRSRGAVQREKISGRCGVRV